MVNFLLDMLGDLVVQELVRSSRVFSAQHHLAVRSVTKRKLVGGVMFHFSVRLCKVIVVLLDLLNCMHCCF